MIIPFAAGTNYPVGANPWNATPLKVAPGYSYFTPGLAPSAQELNYLFNQRDGQLASATAGVLTSFYPTLSAFVNGGVTYTPTAMSYAAKTGAWLIAGYNAVPGGSMLFLVNATESAYTQIGSVTGNTPQLIALAVKEDPNSGLVYLVTGYGVYSLGSTGGGPWTYHQGDVTGGTDGIEWIGTATSAALAAFNNRVLLATWNPTGGGNGAYTGYYDASGTFHSVTVTSSSSVGGWLMKASPTQALLIAQSLTTYFTSSDGATWTSHATPWGGYVPRGLTWGTDSTGACWQVVVEHPAGTASQIWRSADGVTWVLVNTFTSVYHPITIEYCQGVWLAACGASAATNKISFSTDGVTWYLTQVTLTPEGLYPVLHASPAGFGVVNGSACRFSCGLGTATPLT
jgi:hypothetical protein